VDLRSVWVAMGEHLQTWFTPVPGFGSEVHEGGFTAFTGLPIPELNAIGIHEPQAISSLLDRGSRRGSFEHPALLLVSGGIAAEAEPLTRRRGFVRSGIAPLMSLPAEAVPDGPAGVEVSRLGPDDVDTYAMIASEPFSMPMNVIRRFGAATLGHSGSRVYALEDDGELVSSVTLTGDGDAAGIWALGTASPHRRNGHAGTLLAEVMRRERERGIGSFFVCSSLAGYSLFERMGFKIVDAVAMWVRLGVVDLRLHSAPSPEPVRGRW
jgi:ribosomal protein S18 acetylase RimI-like enzyme